MTHGTTSMSLMENPTERLGEIITGIDNARDKAHDDVTSFFPVLNGEVC